MLLQIEQNTKYIRDNLNYQKYARISQNLSSFYRPLTLCDVNIAQCSD